MSAGPIDHTNGLDLASSRQRKREEFRTWFFLTVVMAPVLAVAVVVTFGFIVWISQLIGGPPTYQ